MPNSTSEGTAFRACLRAYNPDARDEWARDGLHIPSDVVVVTTDEGRKLGAFVASLCVSSISPDDRLVTFEMQTSTPLVPEEDGGKKYEQRAEEIEEGLTRILGTVPP